MDAETTSLRPTKAVVIKALGDMLRPILDDLVILDLFAGSGRVHTNLLDEGARQAYAVDQRARPDEREDRIWFRQSVEEFLEFGPPEPVDFIFLDPPYESGHLPGLVKELVEVPWLAKNGLVGVESSSEEPVELPSHLDPDFVRIRDRKYGGTRLSLYQGDREDSAEPEHFK